MSYPQVWSERQAGPWTDCTYSAVLMVLVYAGFRGFPLGLYSNSEREALEASDKRPDGTGATFGDTDVAVARRYGVSMHRIPDGSMGGLRAQLERPGRAFAIAGQNDRLSAHLRRNSPAFGGAHAVCVIPLGGQMVQWLDPLALMGYAGEPVAVADVLRWAFTPGNDARYLALGELGAALPDTSLEDSMNLVEPNAEYRRGTAAVAKGLGYQLFRPGANPDPATFERDSWTPPSGTSVLVDGPWGWIDHQPGVWWRITSAAVRTDKGRPLTGWFFSSGGAQPEITFPATASGLERRLGAAAPHLDAAQQAYQSGNRELDAGMQALRG